MSLWKFGLSLVAVTLLATACTEDVPSAETDKLTLAYLNAKVYAGGAVSCKPKKLNERTYVGCRNESLDGKSQVHLWLYEDGVFKSVNGSASTLAEGRFAGNPVIGTLPTPLPSDIDIPAVLAEYK